MPQISRRPTLAAPLSRLVPVASSMSSLDPPELVRNPPRLRSPIVMPAVRNWFSSPAPAFLQRRISRFPSHLLPSALPPPPARLSRSLCPPSTAPPCQPHFPVPALRLLPPA